jgi:hypothetical protein
VAKAWTKSGAIAKAVTGEAAEEEAQRVFDSKMAHLNNEVDQLEGSARSLEMEEAMEREGGLGNIGNKSFTEDVDGNMLSATVAGGVVQTTELPTSMRRAFIR